MPPRVVKGSVCFVRDDDRILLLQRNHEPFKGKWDGLQGLAEFGETPEETARREVREEAGLTLAECHHRGHLLLHNVENPIMIVADLFLATGPQGDLRGSEAGDLVWVPIADIPTTDLIGFAHITLPRVLMPDTFLIGTIRYLNNGDPVSYDLRHHQIAATQTLIHVADATERGADR